MVLDHDEKVLRRKRDKVKASSDQTGFEREKLDGEITSFCMHAIEVYGRSEREVFEQCQGEETQALALLHHDARDKLDKTQQIQRDNHHRRQPKLQVGNNRKQKPMMTTILINSNEIYGMP